MKRKLLFIALLAMGLLFAGCTKGDNSVTVEKSYNMYVGLGASSKLGSEAPALSALDNTVGAAVLKLSNSLAVITVKGKGEDAEKAAADAQRQAIAVYDLRAENVIAQMISIKSTFEANRTLSAAEILTETGYYTKLTMQLFLAEETGDFQDPIIKQSDPYYMEAIGGEDYSSKN